MDINNVANEKIAQELAEKVYDKIKTEAESDFRCGNTGRAVRSRIYDYVYEQSDVVDEWKDVAVYSEFEFNGEEDDAASEAIFDALDAALKRIEAERNK